VSNITWTTEHRKIRELIPWPRNPRQIKGDQVRRLQESVEEFGQFETVAIGPGNEVYNGHQRLKAWGAKFGPDYVVEVKVSSRALTEKEREKLTILAHKGAAGEWDFDTLANEFEVSELLEWGFSEKELQQGEDPGARVDKAEELRVKWGVELGQLWKLGEHRLICGDCTDRAVVERVMGGEKADLWMVDPPYGIEWQGSNASTLEWNEIEGDKNTDVVGAILATLSEDQDAVIWGANCFPSLLPHRGRWVCWDKRVSEEADRMIGSPFELAWMNKNHGFDFMVRVQHGGAVNSDGGQRLHPTQKPTKAYEKLLSEVYPKSNIVYDPFSGSGTTLIACERLSRKCRAVEISPAYVAVAIQRWVDMTGGTPVLIQQDSNDDR
jgi:DNA modification methylase